MLPELELRPLMFGVLGMATLLKLPLWWCECAVLLLFASPLGPRPGGQRVPV